MKTANFLFIATNEWVPWGGSELLWKLAAEKLVRRGHQVKVSSLCWGKPITHISELQSAGCQVFYRKPPSFLLRLAHRVFPLPEYRRGHLRAAGNGADLVVISQGGHIEGLPWMEAARQEHKEYAVIAQAAAEEWWPGDDAADRLSAGYEAATAAFFVSQANLDLSRRQFGTALNHARVIRNPFNVKYEARPPWPPDSSNGLSVACVGRIDVNAKGQDLLVQVLALPHWRERAVKVSVVGTGGNERGIRKMAQNLKLGNVNFTGFLSDIEDLWSKHHALVLPSRYEGMPLALVEAMLCGRPAITTDVAGHRELVRDGINGFLAKAPTVELLDEAMNRAWENRARLREMGERAASDARKFVSVDPAEDFARELESLAGARL